MGGTRKASGVTRPNPGSARARRIGCRCPVAMNNDGIDAPFDDGFYIAPDCPVHGVPILKCEDT